MVTSKEINQGADMNKKSSAYFGSPNTKINKKLEVKAAFPRTEHSQITFFKGKSNLDRIGLVFSTVQYHVN